MSLTRKQFLTSVATGLAVTALPSRVLKAAVSKTSPLTAAGFENQVGSTFRIHDNGGRITPFVLSKFESKTPSNGTSQFSLEFTSQSDVPLAEGTYDVQHSALGNFRMFVIPVPPETHGQASYRADFNLLG